MPDTSVAYFSSMACWNIVNFGVSCSFLAVGLIHKKSCCTQPLANWNIACGAIGIFVSLVTFGTLLISKDKANKYSDENLPAVASRGPDGRELTEGQKDAVQKVMRDHNMQQARMAAMYHGPIGKMYGFVQSTQSCYIMIMVIIGASFVWSTYPSSACDLAAPTGCEPFLWNWTQAWVIVHFVFAGVACCLMCCGVFAMAALRKSGMEHEGIPTPGGHV